MIDIEYKGFKEVVEKLGRLDGELDRALQLIAMGVGQEVKNEAAKYPSQKPAVASAAFNFVSDKQRRWFFWALNSGQIQVPYRRSRQLGNSWTVKKRGQTDAVVGTAVPYAPYVHGDSEQSGMMAAIGWPTTSEIVNRAQQSGAAMSAAHNVIDRLLSRLGLK